MLRLIGQVINRSLYTMPDVTYSDQFNQSDKYLLFCVNADYSPPVRYMRKNNFHIYHTKA